MAVGIKYQPENVTATPKVNIQNENVQSVNDNGLKYLLGIRYVNGKPDSILVNIENNDNTKVALYRDIINKIGNIGDVNVKNYVDTEIAGIPKYTKGDGINIVNNVVSVDDSVSRSGHTHQYLPLSGGTLTGDVNHSGTVSITASAFYADSDKSLKENITDIKSYDLDKISKLPIVEFDWKDTHSHSVGVIAQDIESVIPEAVSTSDSGIKSVNYTTFLLLKIAALEKELNEIKNKLI